MKEISKKKMLSIFAEFALLLGTVFFFDTSNTSTSQDSCGEIPIADVCDA